MTEFTTWRSLVDGAEISAIPDSVVSRDPDDDSDGQTPAFGLKVETNVEWNEIGGRLSQNVSGVTRAYIYRESDEELLGDIDISALSADDTFTIDLDPVMTSGETYNFVVDAEGSSYTRGFDSAPDFPYTSPDGDLSLVGGALRESEGSSVANNIIEVGNVGFD